jgi:hypothetical protein
MGRYDIDTIALVSWMIMKTMDDPKQIRQASISMRIIAP